MDREIKFRCWNVFSEHMQTWEDMKSHGDIYRLIDNPDYLLLQFTGLKDKKGVDIYEGDLIQNIHGRICFVSWHEYSGSWGCTFVSDKQLIKPFGAYKGFEYEGFEAIEWFECISVVGNKYQNPELLENK